MFGTLLVSNFVRVSNGTLICKEREMYIEIDMNNIT